MKSIVVVSVLFICVSIVHGDVSHINSFNAPIRHAYIYTKNQQPEQLGLTASHFSHQANFPPHTLQQRQHNLIQQTAAGFFNTAPLPMPQHMLQETPIRPTMQAMRRPRPRVKIPKKPIITKNFYVHSAPEETDEELREELKRLEEQPRKHFNVLFVKTPAQTSKFAALNLAKAIKGDQKTVVYVLSKKTSASDLRDAIADAPQEINKPDVFFIKYRTPEEAAHAQQQIQSQYDSLEGPSTITDEGEGPIASVVGSLDEPEHDDDDQQLDDQQQQQQQQSSESSEQLSRKSMQNDKNNSIYFGQPYLPPTNRL